MSGDLTNIIKNVNTMATGSVKWFHSKKGYGFITPNAGEGDKDVFVHFSAIVKESEGDFASLNEGDKVTFDVVDGAKGPEARNVKVTEKAPFKPRERRSFNGERGGDRGSRRRSDF